MEKKHLILLLILLLNLSCENNDSKVLVNKNSNKLPLSENIMINKSKINSTFIEDWRKSVNKNSLNILTIIKSEDPQWKYEESVIYLEEIDNYKILQNFVNRNVTYSDYIMRFINIIYLPSLYNTLHESDLREYQTKRAPFIQAEFCFVVKNKYDSLLKVLYYDNKSKEVKSIELSDDLNIFRNLISYYKVTTEEQINSSNDGFFTIKVSFWSSNFSFHQFFPWIWDFWMCDHNVKVKYHKELFEFLKILYKKKVFTETFGFDFEKRYEGSINDYEYENE